MDIDRSNQTCIAKAREENLALLPLYGQLEAAKLRNQILEEEMKQLRFDVWKEQTQSEARIRLINAQFSGE